ncbi:hypothetical protein PENTCL1PPCAC_20481, partial [Pristionchus entomophagus]
IDSRMDLFSLPDIFLHQLMRLMEIKDRLRLRLTCREFEQIVAGSNAGYFEDCGLLLEQSQFSVDIGDAAFNAVNTTKENMDAFLRMTSRLFNKIAVNELAHHALCSTNRIVRVLANSYERLLMGIVLESLSKKNFRRTRMIQCST